MTSSTIGPILHYDRPSNVHFVSYAWHSTESRLWHEENRITTTMERCWHGHANNENCYNHKNETQTSNELVVVGKEKRQRHWLCSSNSTDQDLATDNCAFEPLRRLAKAIIILTSIKVATISLHCHHHHGDCDKNEVADLPLDFVAPLLPTPFFLGRTPPQTEWISASIVFQESI
jgi:hypothetical protein